MCRILRSQGHRVTLADMEKFKFSASRFSRSVSKWVTLPDVSDQSGLQYKVTHSTQVSGLTLPQEALKGLIVRGEFDWWIPVSHIHTAVMDVEVRMELEKENSSVKVLAMEDVTKAEMLDDKIQFLTAARNCGLKVPDFYPISSCQDILDLQEKSETAPALPTIMMTTTMMTLRTTTTTTTSWN